ncbi:MULTISPECIES: hypothetical protein [Pseudomonas]|uniref:hypothetical protein n=1 Tax=Pseudomonas TaxID=286 RepID=UPI00087D992E|nr:MULTISPECIES: hypothetical protein [Pseudomonas]AZD34749.1 hypothetical protein C4K22_1996 [Pseudomonas chlororaphis subsp. aurantiaca]AZD41083.1 hypothetical protein C4K21_1999 [Pseudomonas chlororaphis subsp. aurantiaca]AZD47365.1 hypothetical protein C4K20_1940 [Pseudomonas chlororaphis subsp. aurantiaca]AZD78512.1 hypothetical protein C4K15_1935 [Pseudomonas chlororaphis subsp. aurantiaca]AZD91408.1 hypothetical protein C4K13_1981 [Pseudomonas chlororaphis subsp. aureofaciens]
MKLKSELSFLEQLDADPRELLERVDWLRSDFDEHIWKVTLEGKEEIEINWAISLENGLLTDSVNCELLACLRYYLITAVSDSGIGIDSAPTQERRRFFNALGIIDYLLLNAKRLELCTAGLAGLSYVDLTAILHQFGSSTHVSESIYAYSVSATSYILKITANTSTEIVSGIMTQNPSIQKIQQSDYDKATPYIDPSLIPAVRAALFHHGYYHGDARKGFHINGRRLSEEIYPNTLAATRIKPRLQWLSFFPHEKPHSREYQGVPVRYTRTENISESHYNVFRSVLYRLGALHLLDLPAPATNDLTSMLAFTIPLKADARFRSVPSPIILGQFKNCVEFHLKYGRYIIDGFSRVVGHCKTNKTKIYKLTEQKLKDIIGSELVALGVKQLGLACKSPTTRSPKPVKDEYYIKLRNNEGLIELLQIYIGCIQFVLGTLMARRYNELTELPLIECLDKTTEWLIINLEKTSKGLFGIKDTQARPIDPLPVSMIRLLVRLQRLLKRFGYISQYKRLFSSPSTTAYRGMINASVVTWSRNLDIMADYFQTPLDKHGRRYYIRQHQLRRFFALMYFHTYGHGGVNAIRWMLGHQDVEQVYRYIQANVDGASLQGAMTQFVLEDMANGRIEDYQELADLLKAKFGTNCFQLYDEDEADAYIQSKLDDGSISIEPVFFMDENRKNMKIVVRLFEK